MPKRSHKECYEVSKEEAKYMSSTPTTACDAITRSNKKLEHYAAALQLQQIPNETFNIEYRVVVDGSEAFDTAPSIRTNEHCDNSLKTSSTETTPTSANVIYENLLISPPLSSKHHFQDSHLNLSKNLILQKFFRSTERNYAAYENLCTGCGYGVFEARGRLCNFCQYVVHGSLKSNEQQRLDAESTNGNIYENICEKCSAIYSSDECADCSQNALLKHESEQQLSETHFEVCEAIPHDTAVKKTKSLGKRDKKRFFHGLIGSLRRVKSNLTTSTSTISPSETPLNRSRLEIVHNVEGYDKVFRTQDTFDLEKICELKRSQTSCSEQHIYGRLKLLREPTLSQSHDQLLCGKAESLLKEQPVTASADCLNTSTQSAQPLVKKRPRISKARLLSFKTHSKIIEIKPKQKAKQSLYLVDNVCQWMTSLRYEIHYYQSFGLDDDTIGLCNPKSIPAKNTLSYCLNSKAPPRTNSVTNIDIIQKSENLEKFLKISTSAGGCDSDISSGNSSADPDDLDDDDCDAAVVTLRHHSNDNSKFKQRSPVAPQTLEQQMVQEFKQHLMAKQTQQRENMAALSETTATTTTPTITTRNSTTTTNAVQHRIKRQAIYLKTDETLQNNESNEKSTNNNNNNADAKVNYSPPSTTASEFVTEHGLASRRAALLANATTETQTSGKRCGIYERDSEFVNDILSAFEQFLSRDTAAVDASTEVVAKHNHFDPNKGKEVNQKLEIGTIARNTAALNAAAASDLPPRACNDLQQQQSDRELNKQNTTLPSPCLYSENVVFVVQPNVIASPSATTDRAIEQIFNVVELISDLTLSRSLNKIVIYYDKQLSVFLLRSVHDRVLYRSKYMHWTPERLVRKYQRFVNYYERLSSSAKDNTVTRKITCDHKKLLPNLEIPKTEPVSESEEVTQSADISSASDRESVGTANCVQITVKLRSVEKSTDVVKDCEIKVLEKIVERNSRELKESRKSANNQIKPPQVPQRDPKTCITPPAATTPTNETTPPLPAKRESPKMTVPSNNSNASAATPTKLTNNNNQDDDDEEDIYQPIWKFKTVGEVQEHYQTDADYFELDDPSAKSSNSSGAVVPNILISTDVEDHGEWETDDEFMFTTQLTRNDADADACSLNSSTMRSTRSGSSITGSTITNDASSITTMGSAISTSLMHHLFRNVGIFYSLTDRKMRAIIYDYDRVHASVYFAKRQTMSAATTKVPIGKSSPKLERSPIPPPRTTSAASSKTKAAATATTAQSNFPGGESHAPPSLPLATKSTAPKLQLLADSVQAWKFMLLDVNYLEDEEDMIVSETEIIRAQESKEDPDTRQNQQLNFLQRFKSASFGNLVDIPTEEDKKSIAERMRNKLQRGVFKLNVRSPKSEKKSRGKFRRAEATSLYLEDGMKPKYPIFGAPLDNLELNQTTQPNVPRFVVDCVAYIERKDCIQQDGLYRASGNKVSIDELKQKLSESYIYDPKLLVTDDIHTLTSLLKQFFRELGAPLIPQETYERLGRNLTDPAAIETLRNAFEEMREPNRSTLKFLIKHLTNVATYSAENRMPASNLAIVWGPCILSANQIEYDIARMNTLAKVLIENYDRIFGANERLVC